MAELTTLEEKLAEVAGLAGAAQETTKKVESMLEDESLRSSVSKMREEAEETERRCTEVADGIEGKKTAILDKAAETKSEGVEMMRTYLSEDSDELDGFEFMIMAEAGEVGHWEILAKLNESAQDDAIEQLTAWAVPIQERHLRDVREGSLQLAADEDPNS